MKQEDKELFTKLNVNKKKNIIPKVSFYNGWKIIIIKRENTYCFEAERLKINRDGITTGTRTGSRTIYNYKNTNLKKNLIDFKKWLDSFDKQER